MDLERSTEKCLLAMQSAESIAREAGNQAVEGGHFLLALLSDGDGLVPELLIGAGADVGKVAEEARGICGSYPIVTGDTPSRPYISNECMDMLLRADAEREEFKDEYLSVEHLILSLLKTKSSYPLP